MSQITFTRKHIDDAAKLLRDEIKELGSANVNWALEKVLGNNVPILYHYIEKVVGIMTANGRYIAVKFNDTYEIRKNPEYHFSVTARNISYITIAFILISTILQIIDLSSKKKDASKGDVIEISQKLERIRLAIDNLATSITIPKK